jgi:pimeloyl-ACP methyl ester carboxylesterase
MAGRRLGTSIAEIRTEVDGLSVVKLEAGREPILYLHGVPNDADLWLPFLELTGGVALDLPGFGRSAKPADFPYSIDGYSAFVERFLDELGIQRVSLVMHDWGAAALGFAQQRPERVDRLAVIDAVPLLPGYRWHRVARLWRVPVVGELTMGFTTKWGLRRSARRWLPNADDATRREFVDRIWDRFDHGTQRAILKLYRSAPEDVLARAGQRLGELDRPALVVWGERDEFLPIRFAEAYAEALGGRLELIDAAGHWPWLGRPEVVERVVHFVQGD